MSKKSLKITFFGDLLCKKNAFFLQSYFNVLQNVLERWYGHGRKCVTLLRSCILSFWRSRTDRSIWRARLRAQNLVKCSKMVENYKKIEKKKLWISIPGSSSNVLGMFSAHLIWMRVGKMTQGKISQNALSAMLEGTFQNFQESWIDI